MPLYVDYKVWGNFATAATGLSWNCRCRIQRGENHNEKDISDFGGGGRLGNLVIGHYSVSLTADFSLKCATIGKLTENTECILH